VSDPYQAATAFDQSKTVAEANRVLSEREWLATEISDMISAWLTPPLSSFRDGPKDQTRNLEIPGSMLRIAPE
jgi:hypothetical protein